MAAAAAAERNIRERKEIRTAYAAVENMGEGESGEKEQKIGL